ncbi:MAG: hypothetical protein H8D23_34560 [Candidatus Brocadiales bacterium]|nr:hypothetical protein [Candidatus Brocadiales bacterium]
MMVKEQRDKEETRRVAKRRKSGIIDYLLLNYAMPDRRRGTERRVKSCWFQDCQPDTTF